MLRVLRESALAGVAEAGGEAVDGEQDGAFDARVHCGGGAVAQQEDDLQQVERLQVGGAHIQGALQHRVVGQQGGLVGGGQHLAHRALVLGGEPLEDVPVGGRHQAST